MHVFDWRRKKKEYDLKNNIWKNIEKYIKDKPFVMESEDNEKLHEEYRKASMKGAAKVVSWDPCYTPRTYLFHSNCKIRFEKSQLKG